MNRPIRELFSSASSFGGQAVREILANLVERGGQGGVAALGLDGEADHERTRDVSGREARMDPVRQPLGVANAHAQPRGQRGLAERGVGDRRGQVVGIGARQARRHREHDVGIGLVGDLDRLGPRPRRRRRRGEDRRIRPRRPRLQGRFQPVEHAAGLHVSHDHEREGGGSVALPVVGLERAALERLDSFDPLVGRQAVQGVVRRIDPPHRGLVGAKGRLFLLLPDRSDEPLLLLVELVGGEGRRAQHLDERVEQQIDVAGEGRSRDVHADRVAGIRRKGQARGAALEILGELQLGPARGPLHQLAGGDRSDETAVRRGIEAARPQRARERDRRVESVLENEEPGAVSKRPRSDGVDEGRTPRRGGSGHASPPSSSPDDAGAPAAAGLGR